MTAQHTPYTVVPKDCLWDLADRFYGKPTLWPMIFEYNNLPEIVKKTGTRILDPDLILIGQQLMIPNANFSECYGRNGIEKVKRNISQARQQHTQRGQAQQRLIRCLQQNQPQPKDGEAMGRGRAKTIARPAYEVDLGDTKLAVTKGPGFSLSASLSGKLLLQDTRTSPLTATVNGLSNIKVTSKNEAQTAAGKLISDLKFEVDLKSRSVKLSGGLASQSNIKGAPLVKMEAGTNSKGQPVLKGSVTYDVVKGKLPHYTVLGEKVTFTIELAPEEDAYNQKVSAEGVTIAELNFWEDLAKTAGGVVLGVASIALIVVTVIEDIVTLGAGTWNDVASVALASAMMLTARRLVVKSGRRVLRWVRLTTAGILVAPMAMAKESGYLEVNNK